MGVVDDIEWAEQRISIQFYIKLEHSSAETIWMIQKAAAMGKWWLAASSQQFRSCIMSCIEFLAEHQITEVTEPHYMPDLMPCNSWFFPKLKSPLKEKRFQTVDDSGKYNGAANGDWENCMRSQVPTLKGTEAPLSYVQCFLYLISSSINVSIFHITWLDTFWTDLVQCFTY